MRLSVILVTAAVLLAGCGQTSDDAQAPSREKVTSAGASGEPAGVGAKPDANPAALCSAERGKARGQCVSALKRVANGASPKAACKSLSRKKARGTRGGTPFALCVSAAAKLKRSAGRGQSAAGKSKADDDEADDEDEESASDDGSDDADDNGGKEDDDANGGDDAAGDDD